MKSLEEWITAVSELAADREQETPEAHVPNDFYGHAAALKEFTGLPANSSLGLYIQHGVRYDLSYWLHDFRIDHRIGFVPSQWRVEVLRSQIEQRLVPIGPYIHYARSLWPAEDLQRERSRAGRILLVFPSHSTHWIDSDYDVEAVGRQLRMECEGYDTILICVYWKDILRGVHRRYEALGFRCVTAGHIYDPLFLRRLRTLIELSDATAGTEVGTHLGYSIYLGKPHRLMRREVTRTSRDERMLKQSTAWTRLDGERFAAAFASAPTQITGEQLELVEKYWGLSSLRSPEELRAVCAEAEQLRRTYFFTTLLPRRVRGAVRRIFSLGGRKS
jgi:hypothetical protein